MLDFFISYTSSDEAWAEWIGWTLEAAGYSIKLQKWDFSAGNNFALEMQRASAEAQRTLAVVSPDYLKSKFGAPEWAAAFAKDPQGTDRALIPIRVRECEIEGLLKPIVYIDLIGLTEEEAHRTLLSRLKATRAKPQEKPKFPGHAAAAVAFPGSARSVDARVSRPTRYMPKLGVAATDLDKTRFIKQSFSAIQEYFQDALSELAKQQPQVEFVLTPVDAQKFTAEVYVNGRNCARCKIWLGGLFGGHGISYSENYHGLDDNSCNEVLNLAHDERELALRATMNMGLGDASQGLNTARLSSEDAAEYLWRRFVWRLK